MRRSHSACFMLISDALKAKNLPQVIRPYAGQRLLYSYDRERTPGRFILTGSTNVLLLPKLADSLAGRMAILRLYPLAQCELTRRTPDFLDRLLGGGVQSAVLGAAGRELAERIVTASIFCQSAQLARAI